MVVPEIIISSKTKIFLPFNSSGGIKSIAFSEIIGISSSHMPERRNISRRRGPFRERARI